MSMPRTMRRGVLAAALLCMIPASSLAADKDLAGTYSLVSITTTSADGQKTQPFGAKPMGMMTLGADGRYINLVRSADLPKFASNNRAQGTPDEMKAIVHGTNAHYGKYTVKGDAIMFDIERGTFPNWDGTTQKRDFKVEGDLLTYRVPTASAGGTAEVVWRRMK